MTTRERKKREFHHRERLFLDTARRLIGAEGLLKLQMARLARACDYATGTLYQHFTSKEDLLVALAADRSRAHTVQFCRAATWDAPSRERIFAIVVAENLFARHHTTYSRLMQYVFTEVVWENASDQRRRQLLEIVQPAIEAATGIVDDAISAGDLEPGPFGPHELMLAPWAMCHGMHSLMLTRGVLESLRIDMPANLLYRQSQLLLNGMNWRPLFDVNDRQALAELVERIETVVVGEAPDPTNEEAFPNMLTSGQ